MFIGYICYMYRTDRKLMTVDAKADEACKTDTVLFTEY